MGEFFRALIVRIVLIFQRNQRLHRVQPTLLSAEIPVAPVMAPAVRVEALTAVASPPPTLSSELVHDGSPMLVRNISISTLAESVFNTHYGTATFPGVIADRAVKLQQFKELFERYFRKEFSACSFEHITSSATASFFEEIPLVSIVHLSLRDKLTGAEYELTFSEHEEEGFELMPTSKFKARLGISIMICDAEEALRIWCAERLRERLSEEGMQFIVATWEQYMSDKSSLELLESLACAGMFDTETLTHSFLVEFKFTNSPAIHKARFFMKGAFLELGSETTFNEHLKDLRTSDLLYEVLPELCAWYNKSFDLSHTTGLPEKVRMLLVKYVQAQGGKHELAAIVGRSRDDSDAQLKSFVFLFSFVGETKHHKARFFIERGKLRLASEARFAVFAAASAVPPASVADTEVTCLTAFGASPAPVSTPAFFAGKPRLHPRLMDVRGDGALGKSEKKPGSVSARKSKLR